jgi:hypothetical protein
MKQEKLAAIIGFPNQSHWDQFQADIRYLTHIGGHQTEVVVVTWRWTLPRTISTRWWSWSNPTAARPRAIDVPMTV